MIVKIKNDQGGWLVFDDVEEFQYHEKHSEVKTKTGYSSPPLADVNNRDIADFRGGSCSYVVIYFRQRSRSIRFSTDRTVYLMNNEGKTIEKIR